MRLDSVLELKASLVESVIGPLTATVAARAARHPLDQPFAAQGGAQPTMALGVVRKGEQDYVLAVRIQRRDLENSRELDAIKKASRQEVDVRYIGRVVKCAATPSQRKRTRPLKMGVSVGYHKTTAGTLGCFVRGLNPKDEQAVMILSNNHVLANENKASLGDPIVQFAPVDGGQDPDDRVATLTRMIKLKKAGANLIDAAVATLVPGIEHNPRTLTGLGGMLAGVGDPFLTQGTPVGKVGRTTGTTKGRVITFGLDFLYVEYGSGIKRYVLRLDGQAELESDGDEPFALGGDSGSLIVDVDRRAIGLLFAASDAGILSREVRVFANPIDAVLRELKVELLTRPPADQGEPRRGTSTSGSPEPGASPSGKTTLEQVKAVQLKALTVIGRVASVNGVGIIKRDDGYSLKVNLIKPPHPNARLPEFIDGVPIKVEVVGRIRKA